MLGRLGPVLGRSPLAVGLLPCLLVSLLLGRRGHLLRRLGGLGGLGGRHLLLVTLEDGLELLAQLGVVLEERLTRPGEGGGEGGHREGEAVGLAGGDDEGLEGAVALGLEGLVDDGNLPGRIGPILVGGLLDEVVLVTLELGIPAVAPPGGDGLEHALEQADLRLGLLDLGVDLLGDLEDLVGLLDRLGQLSALVGAREVAGVLDDVLHPVVEHVAQLSVTGDDHRASCLELFDDGLCFERRDDGDEHLVRRPDHACVAHGVEIGITGVEHPLQWLGLASLVVDGDVGDDLRVERVVAHRGTEGGELLTELGRGLLGVGGGLGLRGRVHGYFHFSF